MMCPDCKFFPVVPTGYNEKQRAPYECVRCKAGFWLIDNKFVKEPPKPE